MATLDLGLIPRARSSPALDLWRRANASPFFDSPPRFRRVPGLEPYRRLLQDAASCSAARPADCVRHLADKDQHARRADRHVRKAGEGASGAASNSSTKMTAAVMLVPAIYRLA